MTKGRIFAGLILFFLVLLSLYAFFLAPFGAKELLEVGKLSMPSFAHPFGTDHLGRDLLVRCGQGVLASLAVALGTVLLASSLGLLLGSLAAYKGGLWDAAIGLSMDALMAFPGLLLALLVVTVFGASFWTLVLALGLAFTPSFTRLSRSLVLELRARPFILRLEVMGASPLWLLRRHFLPLLWPQFLNALLLGLANAILAESGLSFLGLGLVDPIPSLGALMAQAQASFLTAPFVALFPGGLIVLSVFALFSLKGGPRA